MKISDYGKLLFICFRLFCSCKKKYRLTFLKEDFTVNKECFLSDFSPLPLWFFIVTCSANSVAGGAV